MAAEDETKVMAETDERKAPMDDIQCTSVSKDSDPEAGDSFSPSRHLTGLFIFFHDARKVLKLDEMGMEIAAIAVPAAMALAADPLASLVDTALVGHLGPVELAAVGVSVAIFNQISKVAIYPIVNITTSFVAEEHAAQDDFQKHVKNEMEEENNFQRDVADSEDARREKGGSPLEEKRKCVPSVSTALAVGAMLGILLALLLGFAATPFLRIMGIKPGSPIMKPAHRYLSLRALGAPAVVLSLAMQGVFRGFKDTKTPLYATLAGDVANIVLDPILIFRARWGVAGAAIAHALSQYVILAILVWRLQGIVQIIWPRVKDLNFSRFVKCGFLLMVRVIAVTFCVTLAAALASLQGPIPMAAFQVCLQIWLSTSLLADGLAVAGQAILASSFAIGDKEKAVAVSSRVLQLSIVLGLALSALISVGLSYGSGAFTKDKNVQKLIHQVVPFIAATQPINSVAFVFDGINFGASDYVYSAYSMVVVATISIVCLVTLSHTHGFIGIWTSLTIYISLRMLAGIWRMGAARGPWRFLRYFHVRS